MTYKDLLKNKYGFRSYLETLKKHVQLAQLISSDPAVSRLLVMIEARLDGGLSVINDLKED